MCFRGVYLAVGFVDAVIVALIMLSSERDYAVRFSFVNALLSSRLACCLM